MNNDLNIKHDWTIQEIKEIYNQPLLDLVYRAATVHRSFHNAGEVQVCTLLSIKTGGCTEDCSYCGQAARYNTGITVKSLLSKKEVVDIAKRAKEAGSSRFCMAAAWREVRNNRDFDIILEMVNDISELGLEVCCTLGMLSQSQANRLQKAGLYAYNHNIDTSQEHYKQIITTRTYDDRLNTLNHVHKAGIAVCSGGIIGLGETSEDRINMLHTLGTLFVHPESVPINALARVKGTPLAELPKVDVWEMVRMIATARIIMPASMVRLSAGRAEMSTEEQSWCFMAGANSIFTSESEELLVTPNPRLADDWKMLNLLGLKPMVKKINTDNP